MSVHHGTGEPHPRTEGGAGRCHPGWEAPSSSAHLCPHTWAQRCPWLKGPSGSGVSLVGVGQTGQRPPRASPTSCRNSHPGVCSHGAPRGPQHRGLGAGGAPCSKSPQSPPPQAPLPPWVTSAPNSRALSQQPGGAPPLPAANREVGSPGTDPHPHQGAKHSLGWDRNMRHTGMLRPGSGGVICGAQSRAPVRTWGNCLFRR